MRSATLSGAQDRTIELLSQRLGDITKNFIVVVPEKFSMSVEKLLLKQTGKRALMNVQVVTLSRLLAKLSHGEKKFISNEKGTMIVKKIILDNIDGLVCFKKTARTNGFTREIFETISAFKNSNILPSDYERFTTNVNKSLEIKLKDIFFLYQKYEDFIFNNYIDAADRFSLLASLVEKSQYIADSEIFVCGFSNISKRGEDVFESLVRRGKRVVFACAQSHDQNNSYAFSSEFFDSLLAISERLGLSPIIEEVNTSRTKLASHLSANLFAHPFSSIKSQDEIEFFVAHNAREEIELVSENILKLVHGGARFRDFAIACSSLSEYENILTHTLSEYKIPFFLDSQENLSSHPLSEFLQSALQIVRKNYNASDVLIFLKNHFSGFGVEAASCFENYVIKYGINYDSFRREFTRRELSENVEILLISERIRSEFHAKFLKFEEMLKSAGSAHQFVLASKVLFEDFDVQLEIETLSKLQTDSGDFKKADSTGQVVGKLFEILGDMDEFLGDSEMSLEEFCSILSAGVSSAKISFIPSTIDSVLVGDVSTSKYFDIDYLFVVGCVDGFFPLIKDDCGIIVDREIQILSNLSRTKIEPTIRTINKREKFKVFELLQIPQKKLFLTYPEIWFDGNKVDSSMAFRDVYKLFIGNDDKPVEINRRDEWKIENEKKMNSMDFAHMVATPAVGVKKLVDFTRRRRRNIISRYEDEYSGLFHVLVARDKNFVHKTLQEKSTEPESLANANQLFFPFGKTSISQLERFFACPFMHFGDYGLRLREREDAKIEAVDVGDIMHKIAENFVREIGDISKMNEQMYTKKTSGIIDEVIESEKISRASNRYLIKPLRSEAERMCQALLYQYNNSAFKPIGEEMEFGKGNKAIPALEIEDFGVRIEGKIDRIDACGNFSRVIDYKTGDVRLSPSETYYGRKIQLFVYLKAIEKFRNLQPAGAFYLPIKNMFVEEEKKQNFIASYRLSGYVEEDVDIIRSMDTSLSFENPASDVISVSISTSKENLKNQNFVLSRKNNLLPKKMLGRITEYVYEIAGIAISEILSGFIKPSPSKSGEKPVCEYCEYKKFCGILQNPDSVRTVQSKISFENFVDDGEI